MSSKIFLLCLFFQVSAYADFIENKITINGIERSYIAKSTKELTSNNKKPLIIALHGGGSDWKKFNDKTTNQTLEKQADKNGFILIYPQGINHYWNDGRIKNLSAEEKFDDVAFISKLIDVAINEYGADPQRVYVTGMSNGGFMSMRLAIDLSDKITAIAAISAQLSVPIQDRIMKSPVSVLLINGDADPVVPFEGGEMKMFKFSKSRGSLLSSLQTLNYFVKQNQCRDKPERMFKNDKKWDKTALEITVYDNCGSTTKVKQIIVRGGGHLWPGGKQYLPVKLIGRSTRELDASAEIIQFFQQYENHKL